MASSSQLSQVALRTQFIDPSTKIVEDPASDIENEILATYLPNKANEPEAATPLALPPPVTPQAALTHIEGLLLLPLQAEPTANIRDLQDILQRERKRIETLEIQRRRLHVQRRITDFLVPPLLDIPASTPILVWLFPGLYALLVFISVFRNISYC
ncbi:hypothetical protein L211DRAFT_853692 [Terfezia boudieri ATCC MYA-4762]|uniref:Uncharacterized protein n=1 Tax=Terfezia boudieri ATCC MYA-4762 TaxID=1051890 RepID=A0A3N4L7K5_9PEZI|nr:hypothetical protein L211DRAFT_853692 [Terfezia boudieri ATCC MYA-4762]